MAGISPRFSIEVRDTEPGVHDAGCLYGAGSTCPCNAYSVRRYLLTGRVGIQVEVHDEVRYKEVRPDLVVYQAGVPPEETQPSVLGRGALQSGTASVKPRALILTPSSPRAPPSA